jgi:murein DD-endopeptidase MepM/ murein hydrolase activator NlpD
VTHVLDPHPRTAGGQDPLPPPARQPGSRRGLVLTVLAVLVFGAAVLVLGPFGLIPFALLLAFSTDFDEEEAGRSVILTPRNLGLAATMVATFAGFWRWHLNLPDSTLVAIAGVLIALPLALQQSAGDTARERTVVVTKRSLILALLGVVTFTYLYPDRGLWPYALAVVSVVLPLALAVSRVWGARRGRIEFELLRHPFRGVVRPHLLQALNIWLCAALVAGVIAAGGTHYMRIGYSFDTAQFDLVLAALAAGLVLLAALALVPRRRVQAATNVVVALLSGFLALQLVQASVPRTDAVVLDSPLAGEWFVLNAGRGVMINGHSPNEGNAVDFVRLGANGRTHTGGSGAPLADYPGFGQPVLAPTDGRIVEVTDGYPDNPPGTNGDFANHVVMDIGDGRYVSMAHVQQDSVTVRVGEDVRAGQPLAALGNNGHSSEPHLHLQVQGSPAGMNADRTYPMVFRNVTITRGGPWPWGDGRELRTGDLVRAAGQ